MQPGLWISEKLRTLDAVTPPRFDMPADACDSHMHVFGPAETYPGSPDARYTLPEGSLEQYKALADRLHLARAVFVQPSYYAEDNSCLIDTMARFGRPCRGVVFLPENPDAAMLRDFHARGVRGIRLDFFKAAPQDAPRLLRAAAALAADLGWHIELYSPGTVTRRVLDDLAGLNIDFSINHLGYMKEEDGLTDADFDAFVALTKTKHCWVKLTGPYRIAKERNARTDAMARALIDAAPERCVWGTDWPHLPHGSRDTGELLNRFYEWCPDTALREQILVRNPKRLYQFD